MLPFYGKCKNAGKVAAASAMTSPPIVPNLERKNEAAQSLENNYIKFNDILEQNVAKLLFGGTTVEQGNGNSSSRFEQLTVDGILSAYPFIPFFKFERMAYGKGDNNK
jgi:hypothetical protein